MTTHQKPINVFLSYAHEDEPLLRELKTHLSVLKRQGLISTWYDRQIVPGTNGAKVIDQQLEQASIILLLVSADFLAADHCYQVEMNRALERHQAGEARVIPIVVRPCDWNHTPFAILQCLPRSGKAITTWDNRDLAWNDVTVGIRQTIEALHLGSILAQPRQEHDYVARASALYALSFIQTYVTHERLPRPDGSSPSSRAGLSGVWNVPHARNPHFTGRDELPQTKHNTKSIAKDGQRQGSQMVVPETTIPSHRLKWKKLYFFVLTMVAFIVLIAILLTCVFFLPNTNPRATPQGTVDLYCTAMQRDDINALHRLVPQSRWTKVLSAYFSDCTPLSEPGFSCSSNRQILYISGEGHQRSLILQLINGQWFIVYYADHYPSDGSRCYDDSSMPKV